MPAKIDRRNILKTAGMSAFLTAFAGKLALHSPESFARAASATGKSLSRPLKRSAVVYFSRSGHTRRVAEAIAATTGAPLFEIRLKTPYSDDYKTAAAQVKADIERGIRPEIVPPDIDLGEFVTLFVGAPTWWHHIATPVQAWLLAVNLNGKTVMPFTTHGGGFEMQTRKDWAAYCMGADVKASLVIWGRNWGDFTDDVEDWVDEADIR